MTILMSTRSSLRPMATSIVVAAVLTKMVIVYGSMASWSVLRWTTTEIRSLRMCLHHAQRLYLQRASFGPRGGPNFGERRLEDRASGIGRRGSSRGFALFVVWTRRVSAAGERLG